MKQEKQEPEKEQEKTPLSGAETANGAADTGTAPEREAAPPDGTGAESAGTPKPGNPEAETAEAGNAEEEVFSFTRAQVEQMEQAAKQLETLRDQYVRLTAEYDNYRKRTAREKDALWQDAKADTVKAFLAIYDDLERAAAAPGGEDSPHKKGLDMILAKYREILANLGVKEIEALGHPFDPEKHNAVMHIEDGEKGENEVSQVFQAGFEMGGRVIRHAAVQVAN